MTKHKHLTSTSVDDELNDDDDVPTDGELRATGANGPKVSATTRMRHNVDSQVSHSLVEHASPRAADEKAQAPKEPPC